MVRAAEARGAETGDLLEAAGVSREYLQDPDARIPGPTVLALWNALRERTADPTLQLRAPASLPFGDYRIIDYLVAASLTVGEGLERFARFFRLIADAVALDLVTGNGERCLCLAMADGTPVPPVYVDYVFAATVLRIRMRIRPDLQVRRVEMRQPEPTTDAAWVEVFRAPVHFGQAFDRLCFSNEVWSQPTESPDAALARMLEEHARVLAQRIPRAEPGFETEVERVIAGAAPEAGSADDVARKLHMSVRTLQRKLAGSDSTFRQISSSVKRRLAEGYLADPDVSIAEVAFLLGFSDQSAFNRAFRRWTGESPGRWRRRREQAKAPPR